MLLFVVEKKSTGIRPPASHLCENAMLSPATEFLRHGAELHRIRGVRALHHDALEEITAEHAVRITEPLVETERVGV